MSGGAVLGVGCRPGAAPESLAALARAVLDQAGPRRPPVVAVATLDRRAAEPAVLRLAASLGVPLLSFPAARLDQERARLLTPSARVEAATGCPGVAEGAALAAAGPGARLLVPRRSALGVTCALAAPDDDRSPDGV